MVVVVVVVVRVCVCVLGAGGGSISVCTGHQYRERGSRGVLEKTMSTTATLTVQTAPWEVLPTTTKHTLTIPVITPTIQTTTLTILANRLDNQTAEPQT